MYAVHWMNFLQLCCDLPCSFINVEFVSKLFFTVRQRFCNDTFLLVCFFCFVVIVEAALKMCKWCLQNAVAYSPFQAYCVHWSHIVKNWIIPLMKTVLQKVTILGHFINFCSNFLVFSYLKAMQTRGKCNCLKYKHESRYQVLSNLAKKLKNWRWLYVFL